VPVCVGDCAGDGVVTIDDLLIGVNISLGQLPISDCPAFDRNGSGEVTVEELLLGILNAQHGCPVE
jgi:hypothetical protein